MVGLSMNDQTPDAGPDEMENAVGLARQFGALIIPIVEP